MRVEKDKRNLCAQILNVKKQLDDIATKRGQCEDTYRSIHLACTGEMNLYLQNSIEYVQLEIKLRSAHDSYFFTMQRLLQTEIQSRLDLTTLEKNFHPIRLLSTQSNQKNQTIQNQNSFWG